MEKGVIIYVKDGCPKCNIAKTVMDNEGIEYSEVNISHDDDAYNYIANELELMELPVIVKGNEDVILTGFNPEKIKGLK